MKNITQTLKTILLAIILSLGISFVYAWTGPTATPPAGNTTAPINTSTDSQYKNGALGVGGVLKGYGGIMGLSDAGNNTLSQWLGQLGSAGSGVGASSGFVGMEFETIKDGSTAGGPEQKLHFVTHRNGVLNQRALTIDGVGNVGIGTTNPLMKLHINGGWGYLTGTGNGGDPATRFGIYDTDNTGGVTGWWLSHNNDGKFAIHQNAVGDRLSIDHNTGNVGIGTTAPSQKLEVSGGAIKATGGLIIETRTSDPVSPIAGQMWLRTDL